MEHIHIMIIDDNEGDLFLMNEVFDSLGIKQISVVKDGKQAIDTLSGKKYYPELIFLDINLPKKNGHEVLEFIKQQQLLKEIPVVMFSTSSALQDIQKSYMHDASGFMTKPEDFDDFEKLLSQAVSFWVSYIKLLKELSVKGY